MAQVLSVWIFTSNNHSCLEWLSTNFITLWLHLSVIWGDCTFLISSQDPDLDVSLGQFGDGLWHSFLQFVFDRCRPNQLDRGTLLVSKGSACPIN